MQKYETVDYLTHSEKMMLHQINQDLQANKINVDLARTMLLQLMTNAATKHKQTRN